MKVVRVQVAIRMTRAEVEKYILAKVPIDPAASMYWKGNELWCVREFPLIGKIDGPVLLNWGHYMVEVVDEVDTEYNSFPDYKFSDMGTIL